MNNVQLFITIIEDGGFVSSSFEVLDGILFTVYESVQVTNTKFLISLGGGFLVTMSVTHPNSGIVKKTLSLTKSPSIVMNKFHQWIANEKSKLEEFKTSV
ncbi:MAG: hypothetical protein HC932_02690 [Thermales bacterium]|nr:hypothetical protein [Thermales bacterium]